VWASGPVCTDGITRPHRDSNPDLQEMSIRNISSGKGGRFEGLTKLTTFKCRIS